MSSNKHSSQSSAALQRRTGLRRSSIPTSPTSPNTHRKNGRSFDWFSTHDGFATESPGAGSPSLDLQMPSPTFDMTAISPALVNEEVEPRKHVRPAQDSIQDWDRPFQGGHAMRLSDDFGRPRPRINADQVRPSTSDASSVGAVLPTMRSFGYDPTYQGSPLGRPSREDLHKRLPTQDEGPGPTLRSLISPHLLSDRNFGEDINQSKVSANRKSKLNLLNPMSLLARRRSSQNNIKPEEPSYGINNLHVPAMKDFDPSIRGNIVHDFSVPRSRRMNTENSPRIGASPTLSYPRKPSESLSPALQPPHSANSASTHSPMFREHFQDDKNVRQPANTAYLHTATLQSPDPESLPKFARRLPTSISDETGETHAPRLSVAIPEAKMLQEHQAPPAPESPPPPPPPEKRTPSPQLDLPAPSTLPKHMTSTSSRFSYLGQQGSIAQERLLEEKHKEHASKQPVRLRESMAISDFGDFDYDDDAAFDDDGGFDTGDIEVKNIDLPSSIQNVHDQNASASGYFDEDGDFDDDEIEIKDINMPTSQKPTPAEGLRPLYNKKFDFDDDVDDDDDFGNDDIEIKDINMPSSLNLSKNLRKLTLDQQSFEAFHFTPQSLTFSPTSTHHNSEPTPRDADGFVIGLAETNDFPSLDQRLRIRDSSEQSPDNLAYQGLGISTKLKDTSIDSKVQPRQEPFDDSDLYFDDGEFANEPNSPDDKFDERLLDDDNDQIRDIPAENEKKYLAALERSGGDKSQVNVEQRSIKSGQLSSIGSSIYTDSGEILEKRSSMDNTVGLTEDNLAAYHDALAMAATKAAANGKFDRVVSFTQNSDDDTDSPFHNTQPGMMGLSSKHSANFASSGVSDDDAFMFDDYMDDDAMIAAANAEALENDDDGFYGQEFGFYARAYGKNAVDLTNGGYFASHGANGVKRSHSAKNNFQEPSLTPITERSEWSARNSVASFPMHGAMPGSAQSLPSPGIAQLLERDSPMTEEEMSLPAFLKLRGRAFGGGSSSNMGGYSSEKHSVSSSPLAHVSGHVFSKNDALPRVNSSASIAESEDEYDYEREEMTLTQNTPYRKGAEPLAGAAQYDIPSSPIVQRGSNHSRNSSGAESVSYAKEKDGRWVLERRRTGDDGELEVIGREYLAGTRI